MTAQPRGRAFRQRPGHAFGRPHGHETMKQIEQHACFGGRQEVWQHPSSSTGTFMSVPVEEDECCQTS